MTRLPNGSMRLDLRKVSLNLSDVNLRMVDAIDPSKEMLIEFTKDGTIKSELSIPVVLGRIHGPKEKCWDLDFGPTIRGWFKFELRTYPEGELKLSSDFLVGDILPPNVSHFHSEDTLGLSNQFQISVNDPDGFDDISKVFLVFSKTPEIAEGSAVGVDLELHKYFEGSFLDSTLNMNHSTFSMLDLEHSSFEIFSSIVRFNPRIIFNGTDDSLLHVWVGFEEKFTGITTELKGNFVVSPYSRPVVERVILYLDEDRREFDSIISITLKEARQTLSSVRINLIADNGGYCRFFYDIVSDRGRIVSHEGYHFLLNTEMAMSYFTEICSKEKINIRIRAPFPFDADYVQTQVEAVSIHGRISEVICSGPLYKKGNGATDYDPQVESAGVYLKRTVFLFRS